MRLKLVGVCALVLGSMSSMGEVRLAHLFSDHAVFQRDQPVRVFGFAKPGEKIAIKFHDQTASAVTDKYGWWETALHPEKAGGPYTMTVTGSASAKPLERSDIMMGDVWFASGQSNMEMPLGGFSAKLPIKDSAKEVAAANHPEIRLFLHKRSTSPFPMWDTRSDWALCTPETAKKFSAAAYFFGRDLQQHEHVAIGLIDSTWGGMPTQAFTSIGALAHADLTDAMLDSESLAAGQGRAAMLAEQKRYEKDAAAPSADSEETAKPSAAILDHWVLGALYNGMVAPFMHYTIKGAIWYQGEADRGAGRNVYYWRSFPVMIQDWRAQWKQGDFPFLFVQLPSFDFDNDKWPRVREGQRRALSLTNTAMAVTLDTGEQKNIHPPDKLTVGTRLALAAREMVYGEKVDGMSPMFDRAIADGKSMRVYLRNADGLALKGDGDAFEVAGADGKFHAAKASVDGETVVVSSGDVAAPRYVRYAWQGWVTQFVYNKAGLPLGTFTSEP